MKRSQYHLLILRIGRKKQHTRCYNRRRHHCEYNLRLPPCLNKSLSLTVACDRLYVIRQPRRQTQKRENPEDDAEWQCVPFFCSIINHSCRVRKRRTTYPTSTAHSSNETTTQSQQIRSPYTRLVLTTTETLLRDILAQSCLLDVKFICGNTYFVHSQRDRVRQMIRCRIIGRRAKGVRGRRRGRSRWTVLRESGRKSIFDLVRLVWFEEMRKSVRRVGG
jgi:hypothetical protein